MCIDVSASLHIAGLLHNRVCRRDWEIIENHAVALHGSESERNLGADSRSVIAFPDWYSMILKLFDVF